MGETDRGASLGGILNFWREYQLLSATWSGHCVSATLPKRQFSSQNKPLLFLKFSDSAKNDQISKSGGSEIFD